MSVTRESSDIGQFSFKDSIAKSMNINFGEFNDFRNARISDLRPPADFELANKLISLRVDNYYKLTKEEQEEFLNKTDAIDILLTLQALERDIIKTRAINMYFTEFLQHNEPKILGRYSSRLERFDHSINARSELYDTISVQSFSKMSTSSITHTQQKNQEFKINLKSLTQMADTTINAIINEISEIEKKAKYKIRLLAARIEEWYETLKEIKETAKTFRMAFLKYPEDLTFLKRATEKQRENKLRKFINKWIRQSKVIRGDYLVNSMALKEACKVLNYDLMQKMDLAKVLKPVDFDMLKRKKIVNLEVYEYKYQQLIGIKSIASRAALTMSEGNKFLIDLNNLIKKVTANINETNTWIKKLKKYAQISKIQNIEYKKQLNVLKNQTQNYIAPSVKEYMELKAMEFNAKKEQQFLKRKLYIVQLQRTTSVKTKESAY